MRFLIRTDNRKEVSILILVWKSRLELNSLKIPLHDLMFFANGINFESVQILVILDDICCIYRKSISEWGCCSHADFHTHQRNGKIDWNDWGKGSKLCSYISISNGLQDHGCVDQKTQRNDLLMKMHSYSQKCQSDQQRQEADAYQSVFDFFFSFLFLFYLLECAHMLCKYCCSIFLSYKLEVTLPATVSVEMWWSAICTPNW